MTHLKKGSNAPLFRFKDECGREMSLVDLKGKKVILFFYPKDNTPGCTNEVCNLRDEYQLLSKKNIYVIGVSADTEISHMHFAGKYKLPFPLIADTDKKIISDYGVWGTKFLFCKGIHRTTFIINEEGKIEHVIEKVKTKNHTNQILELLNLN